jgi:hypothetical protein
MCSPWNQMNIEPEKIEDIEEMKEICKKCQNEYIEIID